MKVGSTAATMDTQGGLTLKNPVEMSYFFFYICIIKPAVVSGFQM